MEGLRILFIPELYRHCSRLLDDHPRLRTDAQSSLAVLFFVGFRAYRVAARYLARRQFDSAARVPASCRASFTQPTKGVVGTLDWSRDMDIACKDASLQAVHDWLDERDTRN